MAILNGITMIDRLTKCLHKLLFWLTHAGQWSVPEWDLDPEPNMGPPWPDEESST